MSTCENHIPNTLTVFAVSGRGLWCQLIAAARRPAAKTLNCVVTVVTSDAKFSWAVMYLGSFTIFQTARYAVINTATLIALN